MGRTYSLGEFFKHLNKRDVETWFDKVTFTRILLIWVFLIVFFGGLYFYTSNDFSYLWYSRLGRQVNSLQDSIYFSFVTATTTGFGDITPVGFFKMIAIFEVISGLLLLAVVTSKLVSIKQNTILNEVYDLSFTEKVNRLRSSLLLFRQNLGRVMVRIDEGNIRNREVNDIYIHISSLEDSLNEVISLYGRSDTNHFRKNVDPVSTELILNSAMHSFEKLNELVTMMNQHRLEWRREITVKLILHTMSLNDQLLGKLVESGALIENTARDFKVRSSEIMGALKTNLLTSNQPPTSSEKKTTVQ